MPLTTVVILNAVLVVALCGAARLRDADPVPARLAAAARAREHRAGRARRARRLILSRLTGICGTVRP